MSKLEELRRKLLIELRTIDGIRSKREEAKTTSERLLAQLTRPSVTPANVKRAFDSFTVFYLAVSGAQLYRRHVQNLSDNAAALLDSKPISADLQDSVNFAQAVLAQNAQKDMQATLSLLPRAHRANATLALPRSVIFYLDSRAQPTPADVAAVICDVADVQGWSADWLEQLLAPIPGYGQALAAALQEPLPPVVEPIPPPPAVVDAPRVQPPVLPPPPPAVVDTPGVQPPVVPPPPADISAPKTGGLTYESPGIFARETADITSDHVG